MPRSRRSAAARQSSVSWARRNAWQNRPSACSSAGASGAAARPRSSQPMPSRKLALCPPEDVEARRELQRGSGIDQQEAFERDTGVVLDAAEHLEVRPLRAGQRRAGAPGGDAEEVARVAVTDAVELADGGELLGCVLADRLEQLVEAAPALLQQERLLDEAGGEVRDRAAVWPSSAQTSLIAARSNPPANTPIRRSRRRSSSVQQRIAPLHRGAQRPMSAVRPAGRLREQLEQVVEVAVDVLQIETRPPAPPRARWRAGAVDATTDLPERRPASSVSSDACVRAPARSRNRRTAGLASISARVASRLRHGKGRESVAHSSTTQSGSRLVASTWRRGSRAVSHRRDRRRRTPRARSCRARAGHHDRPASRRARPRRTDRPTSASRPVRPPRR
jgi:hypothetical protein